jgi:hypothetical protein
VHDLEHAQRVERSAAAAHEQHLAARQGKRCMPGTFGHELDAGREARALAQVDFGSFSRQRRVALAVQWVLSACDEQPRAERRHRGERSRLA